MRRHSLGIALAGAVMAAGLGAVAVAPAERATPTVEDRQEERKKMQRKVDRLNRRLRDVGRTGTKEMRRRVRQIAAGQLGYDNGLVW